MTTGRTSAFTDRELHYLTAPERRLARVATVGADGTPHVVPVGWRYDPQHDAIEVGGHHLEQTKKYRDARRTERAAIVIDDLASIDPWRPRGIEIRGRAEVTTNGRAVIRIHPERIVSWGLESDAVGQRHARTVTAKHS
jgi:pyridoxamine 5'-phosphate oxidase family protein